MPGLETAFYIVGLIFMGLILLIAVIGIVAVLVIRSKVAAIHKHINEHLRAVDVWTERGGAVVDAIRDVKRAVKK